MSKKLILKSESYEIIGAAIEVANELGSGFLEPVYQEALGIEFLLRRIPYKRQPLLPISYKDQTLLKTYVADFICYGKIVVEIKAIKQLSGLDEAQILNYLKATDLPLGVLINFGAPRLEWKRYVWDPRIHLEEHQSIDEHVPA